MTEALTPLISKIVNEIELKLITNPTAKDIFIDTKTIIEGEIAQVLIAKGFKVKRLNIGLSISTENLQINLEENQPNPNLKLTEKFVLYMDDKPFKLVK
jgi:hypothetical protein